MCTPRFSITFTISTLDGRNRARVIAESLVRVITAIRITSVRWRSYLLQKTQNLVLVDPAFLALRFESRDWRLLVWHSFHVDLRNGLRELTAFAELSRSETWVPKRGGLKPAGKRQESATFLQRSFFDVAVQFFVCCSAAFGPNDFRTAEKPMLQCSFCSAAFRKLQRNFRFRLWHVAGAGFRGVGFRTCVR